MLTYIKRDIQNYIERALSQFKVVLLTGSRQVGKTTLLKHMLGESHKYVTLDDARAFDTAVNDAALFFMNYEPPVIVDEVQYAQNIFREIKLIVDQSNQKGSVVLTGSQAYHLMQNVTESLAGRIAVIELSGLSVRELCAEQTKDPYIPNADRIGQKSKLSATEIWQIIHRGSMPELQDTSLEWELFYSNYVRSYLERDVRSLINLRDETKFYRFLTSMAARTGQLLNANDVADDIGVTLKTVQHWSSILEASGIIKIIYPYHDNVHSRLTKTPKLLFMDCGLLCFLLGWNTPQALERGAMSGQIFETFVISEIIKSHLNFGSNIREIFFYRDKQKREIDLLIKRGNSLYPIEIKKTATPSKDAIRNFAALSDLNMIIEAGALVCMARESTLLTDNVVITPPDFI